ncbi:PAS domain-containing sensor histidine kinase [Methanococcoides burtonii]|uniref:histidine kinase n=1 Tax=Methanococcoides burtonii (strain DSM 6242 / NBRC 107633 / OCM 468 / ACE-M) TaxID=259564 RepID=Q12Y66_METBU|nr:ATP-binding protein [Methanococcoides burtonii]ABE51610.1 pleC (non-motile and phage-resistance protein) -like multisensor signal transduction histidine kinase [Methanococcoides burtonii DSM 6242]
MKKSWKINKFKTNRAFFEVVVIVVATVIVTILAIISGGIQMFCEWFQAHEVVHAPIFGFLFLMSGLAIYGLRSYNETDQEIGSYRDFKHSLQESEEKFRTIFDKANDGIYLIDLHGRFIDVNAMACKQTGYSRDEMLQMAYKDMGFPEIDYKKQVKELYKKGYTSFESASILKDDSTAYGQMRSQIIQYGGKTAILSIARDITERKKAEEAILEAKIEAESANRAKSEFLANMSHELRTPLNSIIGFSDVLYNESHGPLNEYQKKYTSNVLRNGKHLLDIINDILSISNIETGTMELHINEFIVSDAIDEVESLMILIASEKDIDLTCNIDIGMPTIKTDMIKFKQILYNLVHNAIKFTDQGGSVTIGGKISDDLVHISVKDSGIGVSPEDQDKLFNPFFQLDSSNARKYGGTGLGLALVKKFVEMHGGEIWVESEVGKGSTFTFIIPTKPLNSDF